MKLQVPELEFLSAWAREEKALDPYVLPAISVVANFMNSLSPLERSSGYSLDFGTTESENLQS